MEGDREIRVRKDDMDEEDGQERREGGGQTWRSEVRKNKEVKRNTGD